MATTGQVILASITQTAAAGSTKQGSRPFDDLVEFGNFPLEQNIVRITKVQVWTEHRVVGIRVSYLLKNDTTASQLRGRDTGTAHSFDLASDHVLGAIFGRRNGQDGIGNLTFVVFDTNKGEVTIRGPFGGTPNNKTAPPPPPNDARLFGTFGTIVAFAGTDENRFGLCSLSIFKDNNAVSGLL